MSHHPFTSNGNVTVRISIMRPGTQIHPDRCGPDELFVVGQSELAPGDSISWTYTEDELPTLTLAENQEERPDA